MASFKRVDAPELSLWEKADIPFIMANIYVKGLLASLLGVFRGNSYPKNLKHHILLTKIRTALRFSHRQQKYLSLSTPEIYETTMKYRGLEPDAVSLPHDADGYWIGNKNAKKVLVYYHGGGFAMAAMRSHITFFADMIKILNDNGHDIAVFFLHYTLTPYGTYPTQLRQAIGALRYILNEAKRSPADVVVGGDSAGGNLAMATLLHLSHPHPEIEPLTIDKPLAGVFCYAPWVDFSSDGASMTENANKDLCTVPGLEGWSGAYLNGKPGDNWSEPTRAPAEWWADAKTERILILAGSDEILLSGIEDFAKKVKAVFPETLYIVGYDECHDAHLYVGEATQTSNELRRWVAARL